METGRASPTLVLRGQRLAGGWMIYVGIVLCAGGLLSATSSQSELGPSLASLAVGAALLAYSAARWRQQVEIFEHGFVWRRFGCVDEVRWSDVRFHRFVYLRRPLGLSSEISVTLADGREHQLTHLADPEDLRRYLNTFCKGAGP